MTIEKTNPYFVPFAENDDTASQQELVAAIVALEAKRVEIIGRLDTGGARIEAARLRGSTDESGKPVNLEAWETHWINLLHIYERTCDEIRATQSKLRPPARKPELRQTFTYDTEG